MKISTKGRYALEAITYMGSVEGNPPQNLKALSEKISLPERYLEQIFFILRKAKILDTKRGVSGGYYIAKNISQLTAGDVVRAAQGDLIPVACLKDKDKCDCDIYDKCVTRFLWGRISDAIENVLDKVTIEQLGIIYKEMSVII